MILYAGVPLGVVITLLKGGSGEIRIQADTVDGNSPQTVCILNADGTLANPANPVLADLGFQLDASDKIVVV